MNNRLILFAAALLTFGGFALRVANLGDAPYRGDEAYKVEYWAMQPLDVTLRENIISDPQPPLAFAIVRGWSRLLGVAGNGADAFEIRMLPALAGALAIPMMIVVGRRLVGWGFGLTAGLLWAIQPFAIWHSQDISSYAVWSTLNLLALWLGLRALQRDARLDWVLFISAAATAGYQYYLELFFLVALSLFVLLCYRHQFVKWVWAMLAVGAVLAPWYLQPRLFAGASEYGGTTSGFELGKLLTDFPAILFLGHTAPSFDGVSLLLIGLTAVGIVAAWRTDRRFGVLLLLICTLPLVLLAGVSLVLNVFAPRYVLPISAALTLGVAATAREGYRLWRPLGGVLLLIWVLISGASLRVYYTDYTKGPPWPALMTYLGENTAANDLVIQSSADPASNLYYYSSGIAADELTLPDRPDQTVEEIYTALENARNSYDTLWLTAQGFPDWPNAGVVEGWLGDNMQRVRATNAAGLRIEQYAPHAVSQAEASALSQRFGEVATLRGLRIFPPEPAGELTVWVYWQAEAQTDGPYKVFVHLIGDVHPATGTPLWSQADAEPYARTVAWEPGTIYREVYALPLVDVPPGEYTVAVGLYDAGTSKRLLTENEADAYITEAFTLP